MSDFVQKVAQYILEDECFNDFKFRKSDCSFSAKKNGILKRVIFEEWVENDTLIVKPYYIVRIDKLHKWYEPYHFKDVKDQRSGWTAVYSGNSFGELDNYLLKEPDFNEMIDTMKSDVVRIFKTVFQEYCSIEGYYEKQVNPILNNRELLPDVGVDWALKYLAVTKLVAPKEYKEIESIILKRLDLLRNNGEPNIQELSPKIPKILEVLANEFENT